jgi:hypothetical protein
MKHELRYLNPLLIILKLARGGFRQKLHAISFPYYFIKVRIILILFFIAQISKTWLNWPGKLLKD